MWAGDWRIKGTALLGVFIESCGYQLERKKIYYLFMRKPELILCGNDVWLNYDPECDLEKVVTELLEQAAFRFNGVDFTAFDL